MEASKIRGNLHMKSFEYSIKEFPFKNIIEGMYGCELDNLHKYLGNFDHFKREKDQSTLAHKVFYSNFHDKVKPIYEKFIHKVIRNILKPNKFYYQVIPTFRIGLPGNRFVGEFHKDSYYNHQNYEINFNLGLSNYFGKASLITEKSPNSNDWTKLECPYGTIFSFDHIDCMHGSDLNDSDKTMVSFDFRLALSEIYFESNSSSINCKSAFKPGGYFSSELL